MPKLDLPSLRMAMPPQIQMNWKPGPNAQPLSGVVKFNDHQAMLVGFGGATRLEQVAAMFLAADIQRQGLPADLDAQDEIDMAGKLEAALVIAERFLIATETRLDEIGQRAQKETEAAQAAT